MICPRCHLEYEGTAHNCALVQVGHYDPGRAEMRAYIAGRKESEAELAALRAERDRYARALRRQVRVAVENIRMAEEEFGSPERARRLWGRRGYLAAREARGPWKETHPGRTP